MPSADSLKCIRAHDGEAAAVGAFRRLPKEKYDTLLAFLLGLRGDPHPSSMMFDHVLLTALKVVVDKEFEPLRAVKRT